MIDALRVQHGKLAGHEEGTTQRSHLDGRLHRVHWRTRPHPRDDRCEIRFREIRKVRRRHHLQRASISADAVAQRPHDVGVGEHRTEAAAPPRQILAIDASHRGIIEHHLPRHVVAVALHAAAKGMREMGTAGE